jgi:HNH endonuclease
MSRIPAAIRRQVEERAKKRCEYCHMPDSVSSTGFQVDHIISQKQGGSSLLDNLAYACLKCNRMKGSDIAAYDEDTHELTPFYHPRRQLWDDHFQLQAGLMVGKTAIGRVTVRLFQMNHPRQVETRNELIKAGLW